MWQKWYIYYAHDTLHFTLDTNAYPGHVFVSSLLFIMNQTVANQFNFYLSNNLNSTQIRPKWMKYNIHSCSPNEQRFAQHVI